MMTTSVFANVQNEREALREKQQLVKNALDRVLNGSAPCYETACQSKKADLIERLSQELEKTPGALGEALPSREAGILSAHELIRQEFVPPPLDHVFPETVEEWSAWWMRRYSYEEDIRSDWSRFNMELTSQDTSLRIYKKLLEGRESQRRILSELWQRGLPEIVDLFAEAARLNDKGGLLNDERLKKQAVEKLEKAKTLQKKLGAPLRLLFTEIMPSYEFNTLHIFVYHLNTWMKRTFSEDPFDPYLVEKLPQYLEQYKVASKLKNDFDALEYGEIGLNNFYTTQNPAIEMERELNIQEFLDTVDGSARLVSHLLSYRISMSIGSLFTGSKFLAHYTIPAMISYFMMKNGTDPTELLWPKSTRTQEISRALPKVIEQMEQKNQTLRFAYQKLTMALEQINIQIQLLEHE